MLSKLAHDSTIDYKTGKPLDLTTTCYSVVHWICGLSILEGWHLIALKKPLDTKNTQLVLVLMFLNTAKFKKKLFIL